MKNKVVKKLMMIVMAVTMLSGFSFATVSSGLPLEAI